MARYGLRPLSVAEQQLFPGLRLTRGIGKGELTKPPAVMPMARAGWIVWIAETYPGHYLVRMPGGATLLSPHHGITWNRVPVDMPATTIESVRAEEKRLQAEARLWRPGQVITTPGTRLSWDSLAGWIAAWQQLQQRAHSSRRYRQEEEHQRALPVGMVTAEMDETVLYDFLALMVQGNARPPKGMRKNHPTTPLISAAHNRLAKLGATPYRQYQQQQSLRRALTGSDNDNARTQPSGEKVAPHLALF